MALEAIEQVCGGAALDVVDLVSRLVDKSLVQAEHAGGTARYRLLETIRQFADQRLREAGEKAERVRAHRDFFVALATATDPERRDRALEFQKIVDKLFSLGGFRGEDDDSPVRLARRFRELAGFTGDEVDELAEISREAKRDAEKIREKMLAAEAS